ncbi:MAG TPA: O-antigen polymerase, partial [Rhodanobacteraceae bacterium]|nr:O-antigen polymerase [Rhodanobacteraceae bacterium]
PLPDAAAEAAWKTERSIAITLLLTLCGLFAAAFFLSRSYTIVLYMITALTVGNYVGARERYPSLPVFALTRDIARIPMYGIAGVIALYAVTRVLL